MGNGLSSDFDEGRSLFDQKRFRESLVFFEREFARLSKEKLLDSEDGVSLCQFLGLALDVLGDYRRAAEVWERRRSVQEDKLEITEGRHLLQTLEMLGRSLVWTGQGSFFGFFVFFFKKKKKKNSCFQRSSRC